MPTYPTTGPVVVTIDARHADVEIVAEEGRDTIDLTVDGDAADTLTTTFADGELRITGRSPGRLAWALEMLRTSPAAALRLHVPAGSTVHATVAMGGYRCRGRLDECRLATKYGDIRVEETGPAHLATTYGEVALDRAAGVAELTTNYGDVRAGRLDAGGAVTNSYGDTRIAEAAGDLEVKGLHGEVRIGLAHAGVSARTAYGSVRLDDVARGVVDLATTSGGLEVGVHAGTSAWLDVESASGRIVNHLDTSDEPVAAADTVEIRARTKDGTITIRRA